MTWDYYFEHGRLNDALVLIKEYGCWNKPIYTWVGGDHTYRIPEGNFFLFRCGGYQSMRRKNEHAYPVIIRDPLEYLCIPSIEVLQKEMKPKIGFCGLADKNWIDGSLRALKVSIFKLVNLFRKPYLDLTHPVSGTRLRQKGIKLLSDSSDIETNFLIRSSSGGQKINSDTYKLEFWKNMLTSPYGLCVRGAGNYSARFYEVLAMGRIPLLVNTDCILPQDDKINWKKHCVIINKNDLNNIVEKIYDFHNALSKNAFNEIQINNRELWKQKLTFNGFFHTFLQKVK